LILSKNEEHSMTKILNKILVLIIQNKKPHPLNFQEKRLED